MRQLGITLVLAPILDVMDAPSPWLGGRHLGADRTLATRIGAAFVRGFERERVATTAKHFPGHRGLTSDPAVDRQARVNTEAATVEADLLPFEAAIGAGVSAVMTGPGTIVALDPENPALLSPTVVDLLRSRLAFRGLIISDDLDAATVLERRTLHQAAIEALAAGNDLLLVAADNDLPALCTALVEAAYNGQLEPARIADAAGRVRALAARQASDTP